MQHLQLFAFDMALLIASADFDFACFSELDVDQSLENHKSTRLVAHVPTLL